MFNNHIVCTICALIVTIGIIVVFIIYVIQVMACNGCRVNVNFYCFFNSILSIHNHNFFFLHRHGILFGLLVICYCGVVSFYLFFCNTCFFFFFSPFFTILFSRRQPSHSSANQLLAFKHSKNNANTFFRSWKI